MHHQQTGVNLVFHALGDPTRRAIVELLARGPASVSHLAKPLGITITAVSQHVQLLETGGLVRTEKTGRVRTCHIEPAGLSAAEKWLTSCRSMWERRLDRLGEVVSQRGA